MKPIDVLFDGVAWVPTGLTSISDDVLPVVTHEEILRIMDFDFHVMVLSNGERVIAAEDIHKFFGIGKGDEAKLDIVFHIVGSHELPYRI